jgi:hypothetical protein
LASSSSSDDGGDLLRAAAQVDSGTRTITSLSPTCS